MAVSHEFYEPGQAGLSAPRRNIRGYLGERILIDEVLSRCRAEAKRHGWGVELLHPGDRELLGFTRVSALPGRMNIYISAGIHGDEPSGPLAVEELLRLDDWPEAANLWIIPCLNPAGFRLNSRFNPEGVDLNRQYREPNPADEVKAHKRWLDQQPRFDLCLALHEDWEASGFYVYELNPLGLPSLSTAIMDGAVACCPIDTAAIIEGLPAAGGIIRPVTRPEDRSDWPEAFYLIQHKANLSYTLESPSEYPLWMRKNAIVAAVRGALKEFFKPR